MDGEYKMKLYKNKEWLQEKFKELKYAQTIGKEIGVAEDQLKEWCDWIRSSLKAPSALTKFKDHLNHKESMSRGK